MSDTDAMAAPAAPYGDRVQGHGERWVSYGPRLEFEGAIESCAPSAAQFWGVYTFDPVERWQWIADADTEDTARMIASAYLLNIKPLWPR